MNQEKNKFMSVSYQLYTIDNGKDTLEEQTSPEHPFEFITGFGIALDAFEKQLINLGKGVSFDFTLEPSEAFGDHDPDGEHKLERDLFVVNGKFDHENIFPGAVIRMVDSEDRPFMAKVIKIEEDGVTIDTNHPLAGKALRFKGEIKENRDATEEEIKHLIKQLTGACPHHKDGEGCCGGHGEGGNCEGGGCGGGGCCGHCD